LLLPLLLLLMMMLVCISFPTAPHCPSSTKSPQSDLRTFFDGIMNSTGASCGPGSSIVTCKISNDKVGVKPFTGCALDAVDCRTLCFMIPWLAHYIMPMMPWNLHKQQPGIQWALGPARSAMTR
jgi:hypothetical protein